MQFCFICGVECHRDSDHWKVGNPCPKWNPPNATNAHTDPPPDIELVDLIIARGNAHLDAGGTIDVPFYQDVVDEILDLGADIHMPPIRPRDEAGAPMTGYQRMIWLASTMLNVRNTLMPLNDTDTIPTGHHRAQIVALFVYTSDMLRRTITEVNLHPFERPLLHSLWQLRDQLSYQARDWVIEECGPILLSSLLPDLESQIQEWIEDNGINKDGPVHRNILTTAHQLRKVRKMWVWLKTPGMTPDAASLANMKEDWLSARDWLETMLADVPEPRIHEIHLLAVLVRRFRTVPVGWLMNSMGLISRQAVVDEAWIDTDAATIASEIAPQFLDWMNANYVGDNRPAYSHMLSAIEAMHIVTRNWDYLESDTVDPSEELLADVHADFLFARRLLAQFQADFPDENLEIISIRLGEIYQRFDNGPAGWIRLRSGALRRRKEDEMDVENDVLLE
ncbi:uncharacterized protein LTR77_002459 [Saxophila tyrrhenica]|uniref:Uncharacterized protein n=1 Tax=Saxophila tyrrhenica TaxID=1690608 RepID=A0AAV9PJM4_9PEZI|nr:hypothetical protein LTR77_002459 [Saxophila tyrrhenica]